MKKQHRPIYVMNNPGREISIEIPFLLDCGADGVELSIEPPGAYIEQINASWKLVKAHCSIVHTRDDLEFASRDASRRKQALDMMADAIEVCCRLGLRRINVHPHRGDPGLSPEEVLRFNVESLRELSAMTGHNGVELMLENQPPFTSCRQISEVISAVGSDLYVLLDVAHAVCYGSQSEAERFITELGPRIRHIHISDNRGTRDEHLFPGYGVVNFEPIIALLDYYVSSDVALSLESFRVVDGTELRINSDAERGPLVSAAIDRIRCMQSGQLSGIG